MSGADKVKEAIREAYAAFADVPPPERLRAPGYRKPEQLLADLTRTPLAELSQDVLGPYASWAMTTVGDADAYRRFLPRILEWSVRNDHSYHGLEPEMIAGKVRLANWRTWPDRQQRAVLAVLIAAFEADWSKENGQSGAWLCGLAMLGQPMRCHLDAWAASSGGAESLERFRGSWHAGQGFWEDAEFDAVAEVQDWLRRKAD
ncbi:MAG: hypothetical protein ACK4RV_04925 [Caulobacter sp.]